MKKRKGAKLLLSLSLVALLSLSILAVSVFAQNTEEKEDAMKTIEANFSDYRIGQTQSIADDGYIGIPLKTTTYYDYASHGVSKSGYNGTPLIVYVVNTHA